MSNGIPKFGSGFRKKGSIYQTDYQGGAWRDFGNNVVIGNSIKKKIDKEEFITKVKQQQAAVDKIIASANPRTKEDIMQNKSSTSGKGFKLC
jgi:hypothetical protein